MCSFTDNSVKLTSLGMSEENSYYKTDYSFVHQDTGKNFHVNSRKENNIIFLWLNFLKSQKNTKLVSQNSIV